MTGAKMMATEADKAVLEDGGASDSFSAKEFLVRSDQGLTEC